MNEETTNHYRFKCPVKKAAVGIEHCEAIHAKSMKGKVGDCADKLCAVAHTSWKCPFRCAVRYMGKWSNHDDYPRWDKPREDSANLPPEVLSEAMNNTPPNPMAYGRAGVAIGAYDDVFRAMTPAFQPRDNAGPAERVERVKGKPGPAPKRAAQKAPEKSEKPEDDGKFLNSQDALAGAITRAASERQISRESATESAPQSEPPKNQKRAQGSNLTPQTSAEKKPLSLAERAKLMKEKNAG